MALDEQFLADLEDLSGDDSADELTGLVRSGMRSLQHMNRSSVAQMRRLDCCIYSRASMVPKGALSS